ncbi:MAG: ABC transporter permease [Oscillospiraceae bacterium]|nr:ABC transporter permease [Oscillospiraceae bacterium]
MKIKDMIAMCLSNLLKRKVRTLLTVMGVVIGTCAIVIMVSLGLGLQKAQEDALAEMGDLTVITIYNYGTVTDQPLDDTMIENFRNTDHVTAVTPVYSPEEWGAVQIVSGKYQYGGGVYGVDFEALKALGFQTDAGEIPTDGNYENIVLIGAEAGYNFYDPRSSKWSDEPLVDVMEDKLEAVVRYTGDGKKKEPSFKIRCAAVLTSDWSKTPSPGWNVFFDLNWLKELEAEYRKLNGIKTDKNKVQSYQEVVVKVEDMKYVEEVEEYIRSFGYETNSMESIRKPMEEQARSNQMILGGLGAISLLVAALGITNTMIMSIYERTREIGVMKVLGCLVSNIRTVFLMEAGVIGFMGGVIGVIISYGISFVINTLSGGGGSVDIFGGMGGMTLGGYSIIPWWLVVGALVFSMMVGLVSGFSPANRAVKISALSAIRQE